jgi:hypothetical protein
VGLALRRGLHQPLPPACGKHLARLRQAGVGEGARRNAAARRKASRVQRSFQQIAAPTFGVEPKRSAHGTQLVATQLAQHFGQPRLAQGGRQQIGKVTLVVAAPITERDASDPAEVQEPPAREGAEHAAKPWGRSEFCHGSASLYHEPGAL